MYKSLIPWPNAVGRLVFAGAVLAGASACDDGGSTNASFNLDPNDLPTNLVSNSGLEEGTDLTGWSAYTSGDLAQAEFTVDSTDVANGDHAFKASILALGEQPYDIEAGPVDVQVVPGETYALVAWTKGPAGGQANFTASLGQDPWTTFGNQEVSFSGEWEQVAFTFTLPEDLPVSIIRLPVQMNYEGNLGAEIYIDDLQLIPSEPPPEPPAGRVDLVTNGSLEVSDTDAENWGSNASSTTASGTTFSVVSTEAQDGNNSFRIGFGTVTPEANPWEVEAGPTGVPVTEGETYTFSAWVKGSSGARLNFIVQLPGSPYHTFASQEVDVNSEWQQVTFDVLIAEADTIADYEGPTTTVRLYTHGGYETNTGAEVFIDNVQLLTQGVELVTNGGLEASDSSAENWGSSADATNAEGTSFSVTTAEAQEGTNSFYVDVGTVLAEANPWNVEAGPTGVPVNEGETYIFSAWVKGTDGARVNFNVQLPGTPYHTYGNQEVSVTSEWQQVTFEVLIVEASEIADFEGPAEEVRLYMHMGYTENTGADIYVDNVSLTPQ